MGKGVMGGENSEKEKKQTVNRQPPTKISKLQKLFSFFQTEIYTINFFIDFDIIFYQERFK
jgi:hypothetical protein